MQRLGRLDCAQDLGPDIAEQLAVGSRPVAVGRHLGMNCSPDRRELAHKLVDSLLPPLRRAERVARLVGFEESVAVDNADVGQEVVGLAGELTTAAVHRVGYGLRVEDLDLVLAV